MSILPYWIPKLLSFDTQSKS